MSRFRIVLGVAALIFLVFMTSGCKSDLSDDNDDNNQYATDELLYEFRVGDTYIDPGKLTVIPYVVENKLNFQFLNDFSYDQLRSTLASSVIVENLSKGYRIAYSTEDVFAKGSFSIRDTDYGSQVIYSSQDTFADPLILEMSSPKYIFPGDLIKIEVDFLSAIFDDNEVFFLNNDTFYTCCSNTQFIEAYDNDLDTAGLIESFYMGGVKLSDEKLNVIPLEEVYDFTMDFNFQLNPFRFADVVDFRIVINNDSNGKSWVLGQNMLAENGQVIVIDNIRGVARYLMNHDATYFLLDGVGYNDDKPDHSKLLAQPGDILTVIIDYFEGEDVNKDEFRIQNKKFQLLYANSGNFDLDDF
jgi:hypothetical protein